jgi:uncharacterized protein (DUF305 family)
MKTRIAITLLATASLLTACSGSSTPESNAGTDTTAVPAKSTAFTDADVMFAQMMIPHHEQAIEMSDIALDPSTGASKAITALATQIKGAQDPEISQMKNLLSSWKKPLMADGGMDHSSMMGGMMSMDEMDALGKLRGTQFDAAWAKAMIAHHEGAIKMANDVLADGTNSEIQALAEAIVSGQTAEIAILKPIAGL